ncbi:type I-E CRISPR-associated protein Cas6/Cse3/CasE [Pseudooceanicola aestuarii]|uniref:type I-E CRISPR-associated protein Cas6/Cse3/CasE n=1 Tax=Pseudooceanicola aestuarii TaxID=2697319 RepID=UPI001EF850DC|nr:type I-E CRISPR-associated protein Cas6/Cse3/CasE [Pseudooceanicola aestuarii]
MYLSRLVLSRDPGVSALNALLDPAEHGHKLDAHHRLIWSAFAGASRTTRDFLWREEEPGVFLVQSHVPPQDSPFLEAVEVRDHAPNLRAGDRLAFLLRANATRDLRGANRSRKRVDVVMNLLHDVPTEQRNERRMDKAAQAAEDWLTGQGTRAGFLCDRVQVQDYSAITLPGHRGRRKGAPRFGILDLTGVITLSEPDVFLVKLAQGFGRAKSFGCGLMLVRRA